MASAQWLSLPDPVPVSLPSKNKLFSRNGAGVNRCFGALDLPLRAAAESCAATRRRPSSPPAAAWYGFDSPPANSFSGGLRSATCTLFLLLLRSEDGFFGQIPPIVGGPAAKSGVSAATIFSNIILLGEVGRNRGSRGMNNRATAATRPIINRHATGAVAATPHHVPAVTSTELQEAKQKLEMELEEKQKMAGCIQSLQEELSNAMRELKKLKARDEEAAAKVIDLQVEDLKFVEIEKQQQSPPRSALTSSNATVNAAADEFQKKRYVTFADPPAPAYSAPPPAPLPEVVKELQQRAPAPPQYREVRFQRQTSVGHEGAAAEEGRKKKKKKPLIPLVGALFMRRKKQSSCLDD